MRKIITIVSIMVSIALYAENKTIIISETSLPYIGQSWFYNEDISEIEKSIKKNWDEGRRITSVAYTSNGWFFTMAKNSGNSSQSYSFSYEWPTDWIAEMREDGYVITSCTYGDSRWLLVVSKKLVILLKHGKVMNGLKKKHG